MAGGRDSYYFIKTLIISSIEIDDGPRTRRYTHTEAALRLISALNQLAGSSGVWVRAAAGLPHQRLGIPGHGTHPQTRR
jgi:hypothetical protein